MYLLFSLLLIVNVSSCSMKKEDNKKSDSSVLSVTYEVHYRKFEEEPKKEKDLMRLDIGEHSSQYVSVILEFVSKVFILLFPKPKEPLLILLLLLFISIFDE